jgi:hypothetical protein
MGIPIAPCIAEVQLQEDTSGISSTVSSSRKKRMSCNKAIHLHHTQCFLSFHISCTFLSTFYPAFGFFAYYLFNFVFSLLNSS